MTNITYAKVGGPPENWDRLEVIDLASGAPLRDCVEVSATEGWAIVFKRVDGRPVVEAGKIVTERLTGRFEIVERKPS